MKLDLSDELAYVLLLHKESNYERNAHRPFFLRLGLVFLHRSIRERRRKHGRKGTPAGARLSGRVRGSPRKDKVYPENYRGRDIL